MAWCSLVWCELVVYMESVLALYHPLVRSSIKIPCNGIPILWKYNSLSRVSFLVKPFFRFEKMSSIILLWWRIIYYTLWPYGLFEYINKIKDVERGGELKKEASALLCFFLSCISFDILFLLSALQSISYFVNIYNILA